MAWTEQPTPQAEVPAGIRRPMMLQNGLVTEPQVLKWIFMLLYRAAFSWLAVTIVLH